MGSGEDLGERRRVVVATGNAGKLREIREILEDLEIEWLSLSEAGPVEMPEEGADYRENAIVKARTAARASGLPALADDSGLEVDALGGAPGPLSARYGGAGLDDTGRWKKLLTEMAAASESSRTARFRCWAAFALPDGSVETAEGVCEGRILESARGEGGFGYDPVFLPEGEVLSMAELDEAVKNRISHRARALAGLHPALSRTG